MYGLNAQKRNYALQKVENTKAFLDNHYISIDGENIPYSNFFKNSFINSDKYIAELQNRVYSLFNYAQGRGLKNFFVTLTLPSNYHPTRTLKSGKVVKNRNYMRLPCCDLCTKKETYPIDYNYIRYGDLDEEKEKYSPKEASKELSRMLKKIFYTYTYKNIEKENRVYFRVTEPHQDGTPHLHISFFVPEDKVQKLVDDIKRYYPEPLSKIEVDVLNPVAYLMKYILKTLDDLRYNKDNITDLTLWYIYHGIGRLYTSRTLISLEIYRLLGGRYSMNELTLMYKEKEITVYLDPHTNKPIEICNRYAPIWQRKTMELKKYTVTLKYKDEYIQFKPYVFSKRGLHLLSNQELKRVLTFKIEKLEMKDKPILKQRVKRTPVYFQGREYVMLGNNLQLIQKPIIQQNDIALYQHYKTLDIEECSLVHFGIVQNECIKRGLIDGEIQSLNDFNLDFEVDYEIA